MAFHSFSTSVGKNSGSYGIAVPGRHKENHSDTNPVVANDLTVVRCFRDFLSPTKPGFEIMLKRTLSKITWFPSKRVILLRKLKKGLSTSTVAIKPKLHD